MKKLILIYMFCVGSCNIVASCVPLEIAEKNMDALHQFSVMYCAETHAFFYGRVEALDMKPNAQNLYLNKIRESVLKQSKENQFDLAVMYFFGLRMSDGEFADQWAMIFLGSKSDKTFNMTLAKKLYSIPNKTYFSYCDFMSVDHNKVLGFKTLLSGLIKENVN